MGAYEVESFTDKNKVYRVTWEPGGKSGGHWACTCPHFVFRLAEEVGKVCKHIDVALACGFTKREAMKK